MKYSGHRKLYVNHQNLMLLSYSDTRGTLMPLFLFTNSAQRELVSRCTQSQICLKMSKKQEWRLKTRIEVKMTADVISSESPFEEWHVRFTS